MATRPTTAFLPPLPPRPSRTGTLSPRPSLRPRRAQPSTPRPARRAAPSAAAGWQDAVFGAAPPPHTPLAQLQASYGATHGTLHLLALSARADACLCVLQTRPDSLGTRQSRAPSPYALPLPLPSDPDRCLVADAFTLLYGSSAARAAAPPDRALVPRTLTRLLAVSDLSLRDAALEARRAAHAAGADGFNCADHALALLAKLGAAVEAAVVEEAPAVSQSGVVALRAGLFFRRQTGRLYGRPVYADRIEFAKCSPGYAVTIGNAAHKPVFIDRDLFHAASVRLEDIERVFDARGAEHVTLPEWHGQDAECCDLRTPQCTPMWKLCAEDVLKMSDNALREQLTACGVETLSGEGREQLLRRAVEHMDEVERREIGIALAAEKEMYGLAGELQGGRSRRGQLFQELRDAERDGRWGDVVRISAELRCIEDCIADITAEPGSYDRYLDRDEWYRPAR